MSVEQHRAVMRVAEDAGVSSPLRRHPVVAHMTSSHAAYDNRILDKECGTLAAAGYDVVLVAPAFHLQPRSTPTVTPLPAEGVRIELVPPIGTRIQRLLRQPWSIYRAALRTDAAIFHLHDPELLPIGLLLKLRRRRVVYDAHEDLSAQILTKHWIPPRWRKLLSFLTARAERLAVAPLDLVVEANPPASPRFPPRKTIVVANLARPDELSVPQAAPSASRRRAAAYVGSVTAVRGIEKLILAAHEFEPSDSFSLVVGGTWQPQELKAEMEQLPGAERVTFTGQLSRAQVRDLLASVRVGLLPLQAIPTYLTQVPTKLFEYMGAGLPVVASDLPPIRAVVEPWRCGLLVDPADPKALAQAIQALLDDPDLADEMGARGRDAVVRHYNWETEAVRLVDAYRRLELQL